MEILAGRYALVREIGRGASATVFLAHDRLLDRDVAVKLVAPALANDPSFVDRFMREARLAAGLRHPNIVAVFDVGESEDQRPFLAMDLVDGVSLEKVIEGNGPVPLSETSRILTELGKALDYLHSRGLIHRDVKPSNVMMEESGRVLLSDFGIAYARESARYTMTGIVLGTPRYMAPEQMVGDEPVPATDVYAMGVLAFELLAGVPPFQGTGTGLLYKVVHEPAPTVESLAAHVPAGIGAVVARALRKDPAERWQSPGEFAAAFASPQANLTLVGSSAALEPSTPAPIEPGQAVVKPHPPEIPGESGAAQGGLGNRGNGRKLMGAGVGLAAFAGLLVTSYCLAAGGGDGTPADSGEVPPESPSPSTTGSPSVSPSPSPTSSPVEGSVTPTATAPGLGISATPTPPAAPTPTPPPGATPTSTSTPPPAPTATSTSTATTTATPTFTPTSTSTPTATPTASPTQAPPNAPSNVVRNGETLSWSDNSNNESGFRIYWRSTTLASGATQIHNDKNVGPNTTTTSVATIFLTADQTDFHRGVSAYNAAGESTITWNQ